MKSLLHGLLFVPLLALAGAPGTAAEWVLETAQDKATYQTVTVLHQPASTSISDEYATKEVQPLLEFRCVPASGPDIKMRIDWQRFISSFNTEVQFAADDEDAITLTLGVDRSNKITSTRDAEDDARIIDYLQGQSSLAVTVTPYSEVPVTVEYGLENFDDKLAELKSACAG